MPLPERVIQPVNVSRGTLQFNVPDVLEGVTNGSLANIIRQLSSLSRHAEEMFGNLFKEAESVAARSSMLQARIDRLAIRVTQLDSTVEEVSLQDIQLRKAFRSAQSFDQQVVSRETMPKAMLEAYMSCDKPPPLDKLNPYREDGKDGLKFYTDPTYFFELWKQEMQKDTERMMHDRGKKHHHHPGKSNTNSGGGSGPGQKADGNQRHKKRVRQPHNTAERQRQKALGRGEYLLPQDGSYTDQPSMQNYDPPRPNSIDVTRAYQQQQQQQQQQLLLQQQAQQHNQQYPRANGPSSHVGYAHQESIYMPRVLRNHEEDASPSRMQQQQQQPYPPHARFHNVFSDQQDMMMQQQQQYVTNTNVGYHDNSPSRSGSSPSRPTQPPPAPPPGTVSSPTRRAGSNQRDSLPPPPPPPPVSAEVQQNGLVVTSSLSTTAANSSDPVEMMMMLPPPPPAPDNNLLNARVPAEHLPPSPPPPPAPVTSNNGGISLSTSMSTTTNTTSSSSSLALAAPPPPPPPPPTEQMANGLRITNGDLTNNLNNGKSSPLKDNNMSPNKTILSPVGLKKPVQPAHLKAQDGVRSDLLKAIRDGIALKKVEQREQAKDEEANGASGQSDVASILARRVAVEMSDSDDGGPSDSEYDSDDWGDESTA